jgi:hypothetical protein
MAKRPLYYVQSLIPWACEWLCHYELWVSTGIWHGGGIDHGVETDKEDQIQVD